MDSPYANGAYSPPYPQYPGLPPARGFYCSGPPRAPFPAEPPSPAPAWSYSRPECPHGPPECPHGPPECPRQGSALRRHRAPGYSPPQTPGMPIPPYPYGDSSAGVPAQGPVPQPRAPEDTWGPPSVYGVQPRYAWPAAPGHGSLYVSDPQPAWSSSGAPSHPPTWDSQLQDCAYDRAEQSPNQHSYHSKGRQQPPGAEGEPRAAQPRVQFSAQPQLYPRGCPRPAEPPAHPAAIQRILRVMGEAEQLEEEVDEFVGKKTEKSYRLLEEMLTKLLLELDSIETGGQDSVRQARKESVHRVQAILEKLEKKGL